MKTEYGLTVRYTRGEEHDRMQKLFGLYETGVVRFGPYGYCPPVFLKAFDHAHNFKWRPTDTLLMGYPKNGTSWVQQVLWTMKNDPNLDHPSTDLINYFKVHFLEIESLYRVNEVCDGNDSLLAAIRKYCPNLPDKFDYYDLPDHIPDPRVMKSHLGLDIINPKVLDTSKVIFLIRDPIDSLVSYYHFNKTLKILSFHGYLKDYVDLWLDGEILFGSYFHLLRTNLKYRDHPNMYILFYEDIRNDTENVVKKLDKFLGTKLTEQQVKNVVFKTSFKNMKENDPFYFGKETFNEGDFYRKGQVGSHDELSAEDLVRVKKRCKEELKDVLHLLPYKFD